MTTTKILIILVLALVLAIANAANAESKMYWAGAGTTDKIQRANLDGTGIEDLVTGLDSPQGIALDIASGKMYWADASTTNKVQRANLDGTGTEDLVTGLEQPQGIALDITGGKMYWADAGTVDKIQRANLDGTGAEDLVIGLDEPQGIALDIVGSKMYWTDAGTTNKIQRANLDGTGIEDIVTGLDQPRGIALTLETEVFTYQGRLIDANNVADDLYDFRFNLYDADSDGNQAGSTIGLNEVDVIDGYFTVELPFDVRVFTGEELWLEIAVRPGDSNDPKAFVKLSPRQEVTPTPYAIYAKSAGLQVPIQVSGSFDFPEAVIEATNTSTGNGYAIAGVQSNKGTVGYVGGYYGVYGRHASSMNYGYLGSSDYGVYGRNINDNYGYLGNNSYGVYGSSSSGTAGYFTSSSGYGLIVESGNVGIGTTNPAYKLDVSGDIRSTGSIYGTVDNADKLDGQHGSYYRNWNNLINVPAGFADGIDNVGTGGDNLGNHIATQNIRLNDHWLSGDGGNEGVFVNNTGNVGIGTTNPDEKLTVEGIIKASNSDYTGKGVYGLASGDRGSGVYGEATATGIVRNCGGYFIAAGGMGKGVYGEATNTEFVQNYGGYFEAKGGVGFGVVGKGAMYGGWFEASGTNGRGIWAKGGSNGYAGEFEGKVKVQVLEITGGADLSEQFEVSGEVGKVKAGMVVCIDTDNPGNLVVSSKAYDRTVAGIVSGAGGVKPGMLMGQKGTMADGEHPVALTGRVYCWADATSGPVQPGDLLTTSNTPGHAMKITDYTKAQGAILGKAMSSLEEGRGLVLVLVTLQ